jgi:phage terminase large subunit GpA-like protein
MVPCPYCGELIELRLNVDKGASFGLKAETQAGEIIGAYYVCENCGEQIRNEQKLEMFSGSPRCLKHPEKEIRKYEWQPTKKPDDSAWRSYQLNALYSPIGMLTFIDVVKAREKAEAGDHVDMRSYVNIFMGMPFKDEGSRPKIENVVEIRGDYKSGTVPKDVLFLTMAVDVQEGSKKDPNNPPRLELEVLGHGLGYRTWSVLYKSILGETDDPFGGAWEELNEWAVETGLQFTRTDGVPLKIQIVFIDSGDQAETVYQFCGEWINTYPSKGFGFIKVADKEKGDIPGAGNYRRWKQAKFGSNIVYEISTNYYKTLFYNRLKIERIPAEPQKPGFCAFPYDYNEDYFKMLTAEEKRTDGSFHKIHNRNEALDCRVYNLCAADVWLAAQVDNWKLYFQAQKASALQIQQINSRFVLEWLEKNPNAIMPKV